ESTRKSAESGEYLDICNDCFFYTEDDIATIDRDDLRSESDTVLESQEYEQDWNLGNDSSGE
ncbi:hypothetical protein OAE69_04615, partial [Gammaproteobacteria bacterium]|nr:hypothetical protein [Gammaproteobacteria bacterium]